MGWRGEGRGERERYVIERKVQCIERSNARRRCEGG